MRHRWPRCSVAAVALCLLLICAAAPGTAQATGADRDSHPAQKRQRPQADKQPTAPRRPAKQKSAQPDQQVAGSAPVPADPSAAADEKGNPDPFRELGAGSPLCRERRLRERPSCRIAGSAAHTFPISNYGLDIQIEPRIDKVEANLLTALQSVAALVWLGLVYALKGVLLLLEWAFSLDLLNQAMSSAARAIDRLHDTVLGRPWFMAALALTGLWGIWRGLVQMQTIRTLVGLAATVALMVAALWLINDPRGTVGYGSRLANDASIGVLSAATSGRGDDPQGGLARAQTRLFDQLVVRPWCALQFGSVRWCLARRGGKPSQAELWLAFPAEGKERKALYELTKKEGTGSGGGGLGDALKGAVKGMQTLGPAGLGLGLGQALLGGGDDDKTAKAFRDAVPVAPERVRMQEQGGTFTRIALLTLVAIGLLGAICLLLYLAIKLVLAGLLALILILLSPAMLLAPAFGEAGRDAFLGWAKRLGGAIAAKLIFALLLAVVVVSATSLAALPIGWFGAWLIQAAFWWGILIKRHELLGFLSVGAQGERQGQGSSLWVAHRNARAAGAMAKTAGAVATVVPARAHKAQSAARLGRQEAARRSVGEGAQSELDRAADRARSTEVDGAQRSLAMRPELERTRQALDRELSPYERTLARATAEQRQPRPPTEQERQMLAKRDRVETILGAADMRRAEQTVREADRARAREGTDAGRIERAAWREHRRRDLAAGLAPEHESSLRAAAIDPRDYEHADPARKAELRRVSQRAIERDRDLLGAVRSDEAGQPTAQEVRSAKRHVDPVALSEASKRELARARQERSVRKRRANLHRRR